MTYTEFAQMILTEIAATVPPDSIRMGSIERTVECYVAEMPELDPAALTAALIEERDEFPNLLFLTAAEALAA